MAVAVAVAGAEVEVGAEAEVLPSLARNNKYYKDSLLQRDCVCARANANIPTERALKSVAVVGVTANTAFVSLIANFITM